MKILFAAPENAWGGFLELIRKELPQHQFEAAGEFKPGDLHGFDVLIPTMAPIDDDALKSADQLKLIQQCGAGLDKVDIKAAKNRDIWVANVPSDISGNADSVAELGIYFMIGLSRNFKGMAESIKGRKSGEPKGKAIAGKTVGLLGLGGISKSLIHRLKAFGVEIISIKRSNQEEAARKLGLKWVGKPEDLEYLLQRSDYVILCLPLTPQSENMINESTLAMMKEGSYLINLSRGGLIDHNALREALATGHIAGAGLDVFWEEPPDPNDAIFNYNLMATPHIGGSTDNSIAGIVKGVAENLRRLEKGETLLHTKN
jgi:phosphoglycerate dehydrogenase-like enzyme